MTSCMGRRRHIVVRIRPIRDLKHAKPSANAELYFRLYDDRFVQYTAFVARRLVLKQFYCLAITLVILYHSRCLDPVGLMLHLRQRRIQGKAMVEEAPNVVTEDGFRRLLADGYLIEVVCKKAAEKRHVSWYGAWLVIAVAEDGRDEKVLVSSRNYLRFREFKTIVGLVGFLANMGCTTAKIPLSEGGRERHAAPGRNPAPQTGPVLVKDS
jgi:hypothetical protein